MPRVIDPPSQLAIAHVLGDGSRNFHNCLDDRLRREKVLKYSVVLSTAGNTVA
ncbi:MAG: hypothetical protein KAI77_03725 [Gammaproteobacteria bacterium]|nr:hypothetical protein [Gammaproteobacteria bacterium]